MQAEQENPTLKVTPSSSKRILITFISIVCISTCIYLFIGQDSLYSVVDRFHTFQAISTQIPILSYPADHDSGNLIESVVARRFNIIEEVKNHTKRFNFANSHSGAKISQKTKGMLQTKSILTDDPDAYLMTPNNEDPKYFVLSLSQDIQIETVMIINQERYSSRVKHFVLYGSRDDPSETWIPLGYYEADDSNNWQAFSVAKKKWVRHLKFQIESVFSPHEYYCILTQIKQANRDYRVFGSSLMQGIKEDLSLISKPSDKSNYTNSENRAQDHSPIQPQALNTSKGESEIKINSICPNQVNLASLLSMNESELGLSENKANYFRKFQEIKLQILDKRTQLKALTQSDEDPEDQESVFKQLAQRLDDMKIYHYILEQFLLVDFADTLESKLKKVQLVQDQILKAVNQSNEDQVNLVLHSVQHQAEKVKLQLVKENQSLQQKIFVFEVIVILLLLLVLVVSLQNLHRKKTI